MDKTVWTQIDPSHHNVWNLISLTTYLCISFLSALNCKNKWRGIRYSQLQKMVFHKMSLVLWCYILYDYRLTSQFLPDWLLTTQHCYTLSAPWLPHIPRSPGTEHNQITTLSLHSQHNNRSDKLQSWSQTPRLVLSTSAPLRYKSIIKRYFNLHYSFACNSKANMRLRQL